MKIYDISWPLNEKTTQYKNKKTIQLTPIKTFDVDGVRETLIAMSAHSGTHIDAPAHFLRDGKTVDELTVDRLIGRAQVIDLMTVVSAITAQDLARYNLVAGEIVLLRTSNSAAESMGEFDREFIYLDPTAAQYLVSKGVKAVGIDYLGIERGDPEHRTHTTLMHGNVVIIEGLRLAHVPAGTYFMVCLPIALMGLEAAPARAILMTDK